jgi:hypothetical protein
VYATFCFWKGVEKGEEKRTTHEHKGQPTLSQFTSPALAHLNAQIQ